MRGRGAPEAGAMKHPLSGQTAVVTGGNSGVGRSSRRDAPAGGRPGHVGLQEPRTRRAGAGGDAGCGDCGRQRGRSDRSQRRETGGDGRRSVSAGSHSRNRRPVPPGRCPRGRRPYRRTRLPAIDILVNNAGISSARRTLSADAFELTFATNHIGHFLLTHLLLERLEAGRGRIVNVSSRGHRGGDLRRASLDDIAHGRAWNGPLQAYADSKLANILFTFESVRRWGGRGITANAVHPGVLATDIWNKTPWIARLLIRPFTWFMDRPEVGGAAVMNLVGGPAGGVTGSYFNVQREEKPSAQARDRILAHELWERSLEWTRVSFGRNHGESDNAQP